MIVTIDFDKKEISYPEDVKLYDLAPTLVKYFDPETWGHFKVVINDRANTDTDTSGEFYIS